MRVLSLIVKARESSDIKMVAAMTEGTSNHVSDNGGSGSGGGNCQSRAKEAAIAELVEINGAREVTFWRRCYNCGLFGVLKEWPLVITNVLEPFKN